MHHRYRSTMVRRLETGEASTNDDGVRRQQRRILRERVVIDLTADVDEYVTSRVTRRRLNPTTPPEEYDGLSLAQPGSRRTTTGRAVAPPPPAPSRTEPVPEYVLEAPPAPHNDVVMCPQYGYLFIAFLYTASSSMLNVPDPVDPLDFDWIKDLELGDP